ncbi:MAG: Hsp20/alpha crystallin family protein [Spirochaetaceae bacterium]|jgi:HSP20 family protein|nr:Hsp20/alpha crystallin family protein [Spirochaetaceae bacterium]
MKSVSLYRPATIVDELLESFFDSTLAPFAGNRVLNKLPLVDVQETGNAYLVEAELPGLDEKHIKVQMDGGKLTIETEQDEQTEEKQDGSYLIRERRKASFSRSFTLPENADPESVSAVFKNGILSLEIKKRTESAKRLIEINAQ